MFFNSKRWVKIIGILIMNKYENNVFFYFLEIINCLKKKMCFCLMYVYLEGI